MFKRPPHPKPSREDRAKANASKPKPRAALRRSDARTDRTSRSRAAERLRREALAEIAERLDGRDGNTAGSRPSDARKAPEKPSIAEPPAVTESSAAEGGAGAGERTSPATAASAAVDGVKATTAKAKRSRPPRGNLGRKGGNVAESPGSPTHSNQRPKRLSALDAAAEVLAATSTPMSASDLIATMKARQLWTSPGGKTPEATLYAAIVREIAAKGPAARFRKHGRGVFVAARVGQEPGQ